MAQEEMFRKVDGVAETVEVKELLSHAPSEMSGGQKQRVSMAGVMIDDVDILLFDEPLANLDPATGKKAIALIDRIQKEQKKTIVIIEHRLEDVLYKDVDRIVLESPKIPRFFGSFPSIFKVPVLSPSYEKGISPLIQFDNVDFPDPDGPMMSTFSPG